MIFSLNQARLLAVCVYVCDARDSHGIAFCGSAVSVWLSRFSRGFSDNAPRSFVFVFGRSAGVGLCSCGLFLSEELRQD